MRMPNGRDASQGAKLMWIILLLITGLLLSACSVVNSVFNPSPYEPTQDENLTKSNVRPLSFESYPSNPSPNQKLLIKTANKLQILSVDYADQRNDTMIGELLFDIPILGLGIATLASGIFKGPQDQILALGLAGASVVGTRLYFNPQGKIVAYNSAALALTCAASVAAALSTISDNDGKTIAGSLEDDIDAAKGSTDLKLVAALSQAQTALTDLNTALATLEAAPVKLQTFANQVIRNSTSKIVTGSQNTDAVLAQIRAATSTSAPKPAKLVTKPSTANERTAAIAAAALDLPELTAKAEAYAQAVKEAWTLSACAAT
jgi:hypothetical protein